MLLRFSSVQTSWADLAFLPHTVKCKCFWSGKEAFTGSSTSFFAGSVDASYLVHKPGCDFLPCSVAIQAGCMYVHGGVVDIQRNKRTGSLFKMWLVVPSLLELSWEKLLEFFPHLTKLTRSQLLHLGLTQGLIERLKWEAPALNYTRKWLFPSVSEC